MDEELEALYKEAEAKGLVDPELRDLYNAYKARQTPSVPVETPISEGGATTPQAPPDFGLPEPSEAPPAAPERPSPTPFTGYGEPSGPFPDVLRKGDVARYLPSVAAIPGDVLRSLPPNSPYLRLTNAPETVGRAAEAAVSVPLEGAEEVAREVFGKPLFGSSMVAPGMQRSKDLLGGRLGEEMAPVPGFQQTVTEVGMMVDPALAVSKIAKVPGLNAIKAARAEKAAMKAAGEAGALLEYEKASAAGVSKVADDLMTGSGYIPVEEGVSSTAGGGGMTRTFKAPDELATEAVKAAVDVPLPVGAKRNPLDVFTNMELALEERVADATTRPLVRGMWNLIPDKAKEALGRAAMTGPEKVSPVLAQILSDSHHAVEIARVEGLAAGKRLAVATKQAGIAPGSADDILLYRHIGGEPGFTEWPKSLPESLKPAVADVKGLIQNELDIGVAHGIVSEANQQEHLQGLLTRYYNDVRKEYGLNNTRGSHKIDELFLRNDSYGGVINATMAEVEDGIRALGVDPKTLPYIHELDGSVAVKFGVDEQAMAFRDALREKFGQAWDSDLRPLSFEERVRMAEDMNPRSAVARTLTKTKVRNAMASVNQRVADTFSEPAVRTNTGRVLVPEGKVHIPPDEWKWGALRDRVVPQDVFDQLKGSTEVVDDWADAIGGAVSAMKSDLIGNLATGTVNLTTDVVYGFMDGLSIVDPGSFRPIKEAMTDIYNLRAKGQFSPKMRMWMEHGGSPAGIAFDILDQDIAELSALEAKNFSKRKWGELAAQVLIDSPNLEVKGLSPWANRGIRLATSSARGALYGGLTGGPAGAVAEALSNAVSQPLRTGLAKLGKLYFSVGDPAYQYALFLRNMDRYGGDAALAMERTLKFSQTFSREAMPEFVLKMTGRAPGQSPVARVAGQLVGPTFPGYPVNWVRLAKNMVVDRPIRTAVASAMALGIPAIFRDKAVLEGRLSQEASDKMAEDFPQTIVVDDGQGGNTAYPFERFGPGPSTVVDFTRQGVAVGIGTSLGAKAVAAMGGEGRLPEALGGWKVRKDKEALAPSAAILRLFSELSPYSGEGRVMQEFETVLRGEKDYRGRDPSWMRAILASTIGLRPRPLTSEDVMLGDKMEKSRQKKAVKTILRSGRTTEAEKARALDLLKEDE